MQTDPDFTTMQKPERVSSRLIKKERSKLLKQTLWLVGGGLVLVVGFIFLVLPNFINVVNSVLSTNPIPEEETVIIQPPDLVAPISATFSAQLALNGVGTSGLETIILVNGIESAQVPAATDGAFSTMIDLTEGENTITAYSKDEKGNESKTGKEYMVILDTQPPLLELTEPQEGQQFENKQSMVTFAGKTDPNTKIYLNDRFFLPRADGSFSTTASINPGENVFKIKAVDQAGNQVELERKVTRK